MFVSFFGVEIEQNSILGDCQTFVLFSGPVVQNFRHYFFGGGGGGGIDEIRAIFCLIQFLYLNNPSLILKKY